MPSVLGLDLGAYSFRAVEVDKSKKGNILLKSGAYENPKINDDKAYSEALKSFVAESGFGTSKTITALEEKDVFMRVIDLPEMSDKELKTSIMFEAEQYIPLRLDEVNFSNQKLDKTVEEKGKISVQLVAARKTLLEKYIQIIKSAHLTPLALEPEALSIARALSNKKSDPTASLILHMGHTKSLIIITYKESVVFVRTLSVGGISFTRAIEQSLGLEASQAEEYKKAYGLDKEQAEGKIYEVLQPVFKNILSEVRRAQVFFTSRHTNVTINKVTLSGGSALMPGLLLYMANNLDLEVELANPFRNLIFSKELESKKEWYVEQGPLFSVSVGLSLKDL